MEQYWQTISYNEIILKINVSFGLHIINLTVFDNRKAWKAKITEAYLEKHAKIHKTDLLTYLKKLKLYLTVPSEGIKIKLENSMFKLSIILENKMKVIYFETEMEAADFVENIFSAVDTFSEAKQECFEDLTNLRVEYKKLQQDNTEMIKKLHDFVERKKIDDQELLSKFVMLLNEKKRQIQHLNDTLIAFKKGRSTINPPMPERTQRSKKQKKQTNSKQDNEMKSDDIFQNNEVISDDSNSSKYNSDDDYNSEKEGNTLGRMKGDAETNENLPSTSRVNFQLDDEIQPLHRFGKRTRIDRNSHLNETSLPVKQPQAKIEEASLQIQEKESEESPVIKYSDTQDMLNDL